MDQILLERLLARMEAKIDSSQEKMDAIEHKMLAKMETTQHEIKAHHKEIMAKMDAQRGVTPTCLGKEENKPLKRKYVEDENEGIKKKRKVKSADASLYKPPTVNELNQLGDTENLFLSTLFRLQFPLSGDHCDEADGDEGNEDMKFNNLEVR
jgi:phenylalanyl-tRNA synthetase alpha subunit